MKADSVSEESTAASITADVVEESDPTFPKIVEVTTLATDSHTPITTTAQPSDSIVTVQSLPVSNNVTSVQTINAFTTSGEKIILPNSVLADLNKLGSGPLYLVPSTSIPSGATVVTASSSTPSSSGTVNVIPASAVQTLTVPSHQRLQVDKEGRTVQTMVKRPALSQSGQVITKVIITSNPLTGQATTQQVCLAPVLPVSSEGGGTSLGQTVKIVTQPQGLLSPTKTITLNQPTLLTSPNKQPLIAAIPGTPSKQGILLNKIAISPAKTPTKFTMIPMTVSKSPQRIAPAPAPVPIAVSSSGIQAMTSTCATTTVTVSKPGPITVSPQKVIFRQAVPTKGGTTLIGQPQVAVTVQNPSSVHTPTTTTSVKQVTVPISSASNVQQIQVPGSKFHYVRLVSTPVNTTNSATKTATVVQTTNTKTIVPGTVASTLPSQTSGQMKIAVPIAPAGQQTVVSKASGTQQRILFPASNVTALTPIRSSTGNLAVPATSLAQLPPGTTLISTGGNMQGIVMVPAQYVTQFQQLGQQSTPGQTTSAVTSAPVSTPQPILPAQTTTTSQTNFVPIAAASSGNSYDPPQQSQSSRHVNGSTLEPNGVRPRKPCNCTKSQCLKLYCDCFANGEFCNNCNCSNCYNNLDHEEERQKAIKACLDRNPLAFHPKIGKGKDGEQERRHNKGCNCKRSGCLKNYCECYEAKIMCSSMCKCVGCKNFEESAERKTLMHLADAAEVRVQQQTAAKNKLSSQVQDVPSKPPLGTTSGERLPFSFVTPEVVQATCQCLLAQTEEGERTFLPETTLEKLVLEEFGRCLVTIIDYANRTKGKGSPNVDSASGITRSGRSGPNS